MSPFVANINTYRRFLSRNKLYTAITVIGFAISISLVILMASHVHHEFSIDNFHGKKDKIKTIVSEKSSTFPNKMAAYIKDKCPEVDYYTRVYTSNHVIKPLDGESYIAKIMFAEHNFFDMFDFELKEGDPKEALRIKSTVLLSEAMANKEFGDKSPIGENIIIGDIPYKVTGIFKNFPKNTQFNQPDYIVSYLSLDNTRNDDILNSWNNASYNIFFLEKENANFKEKEKSLLEELKKDYFAYEKGWTTEFKIIPFNELYFHPIVRQYETTKSNNLTTVVIYLGIVLLILIIAILNYINMTVAQTSFRGSEIATRKLLGADNKSVILQGLLESIFMIFITSIIGFGIALVIKPYFESALDTSIYFDVYLSVRYIIIVLSSILLIGFIAGIIPALMTSKFQPIEVLKGGYRRSLKSTYSKVFTTFQYFVSIVLITVGSFIILQFNFLINNDIGVDKDRTLIISHPCKPNQKAALMSEIMKIPGVEIASFTAGDPIDGGNNNTEEINGESISFQIFTVDSSFYKIFNIEITSTAMHQLNGVIMNQQGINILNVDTTNYIAKFGNKEYPVAGVAKDFHFRPLTDPIGPAFIQPMSENDYPWSLLVKISPNADLLETAKQIKETHTKFVGHSLQEMKFIDDTVNQWYEKENRLSKLILVFSIFSIVITVMGIFAMALYQVEQRKKEIAIRKINGATEIQILAMFNYNSIKYVILAFALGVPISYYIVSRWIENFAFRISISPIVFLIALFIVLLLTLISISLMSWRAANANPVKSLGSE